MAGTYGEPGKNTFAVTGVGGVLSPVVNETTGVTQVYRKGALNTYQSLGTYNPKTNKFTPGSNITDAEKKSLSSEGGLSKIKSAGSTAVVKGVQTAGGTPDEAQAKSNKLFSPNKANNPGTGQPTTANIPAESGAKTSGFGDFIYPEDLGKTKQDIVKFTMLEYKPSGLNQTGAAGGLFKVGGNRDSGRKGIGTVILPIPSGISDTNAVQWGAENMNAAEAFAANAALTGITQGLAAGTKVIASGAEQLQEPGTSKEGASGLANVFASAATGVAGAQILARTQGAVLNPNMELLFQGPSLRPFNFTFKMSARNEKESKQIIGILNFFKRGMSPIKSDTNLFLKAPNTFRIQYIHRPKGSDKDHPYIGKIKECALQNITVNYTPEGQYATFRDGVLVSYEMQMTFQELEPVYNSDYEGLEGTVGY